MLQELKVKEKGSLALKSQRSKDKKPQRWRQGRFLNNDRVELKVCTRIVWHRAEGGSGFCRGADCRESETGECNEALLRTCLAS